jgi:hypothetical protein
MILVVIEWWLLLHPQLFVHSLSWHWCGPCPAYPVFPWDSDALDGQRARISPIMCMYLLFSA